LCRADLHPRVMSVRAETGEGMYRAAHAPDILRTADFRGQRKKGKAEEGSSEMRRQSR
jgi:hypothetical protein